MTFNDARRPIGADQGRLLHVGPHRTICPRPGASPLEILETVLPMSDGGLADEHWPIITTNPWKATPRT